MREPCTVTGGDYSYQGHIVAAFQKLSGKWRCVVEDANGRLFIHNHSQLRISEKRLQELYDASHPS